MPQEYKDFGVEWAALNSDWTVKDHGDELLDRKWRNQSVIDDLLTRGKRFDADRIALATQLADVISYELLLYFGGLYVNTDIQPVRPLENLFEKEPDLINRPMAGMEDDYWAVNAVMWAPIRNINFWHKVINELPNRYFSMPGAFMNATTGPHLLTDVWSKNRDELVVLNRNYFNPIHWSQVQYGHDAEFHPLDLPDKTIAVHHWGHRKNQRNQRVLEHE